MTTLFLRCSRWLKLMIGAGWSPWPSVFLLLRLGPLRPRQKKRSILIRPARRTSKTYRESAKRRRRKSSPAAPIKVGLGLSKAGVNDAEIDKLKGLVTATEPKTPAKTEEKSSEKGKASENGKASDNGKMKSQTKWPIRRRVRTKKKSSKMESKTGLQNGHQVHEGCRGQVDRQDGGRR